DVEDDLPPAPEPVEPDPAVLLVDEVLAVVAVDHGVVDIEPPRRTECRPGEDRAHADTSAGADPRSTTSTPASAAGTGRSRTEVPRRRHLTTRALGFGRRTMTSPSTSPSPSRISSSSSQSTSVRPP